MCLKRGSYKSFSVNEKQSILDCLEKNNKNFSEVAAKVNISLRRLKAIFKKRNTLQASGRISRNQSKNLFLFSKGLEFFLTHKRRPSILALPKYFLGLKDFFKSNGQKTNFTNNFKKYLYKNTEENMHELVDKVPLCELDSLGILKNEKSSGPLNLASEQLEMFDFNQSKVTSGESLLEDSTINEEEGMLSKIYLNADFHHFGIGETSNQELDIFFEDDDDDDMGDKYSLKNFEEKRDDEETLENLIGKGIEIYFAKIDSGPGSLADL